MLGSDKSTIGRGKGHIRRYYIVIRSIGLGFADVTLGLR